MERNDKAIEVLNDLIRINNDRVEGYQKAITKTDESDADLRIMFSRMADESRTYSKDLENEVRRLGGEPASGTTASGKVYRVWMDVKSGISSAERKSVLEECEFGEDAAQRAYEKALDTSNDLPLDLKVMIQSEQSSLKNAHDTIKSYRDSQRTKSR